MAFPSATVSANVEDPAILDHWEGDLITGSQNTHISHFGGPSVALYPVHENTGERHHQCGTSIEHADMTIDGGIALATIWDRGMKLAQHKGLTSDTTVRVYSCDSQSRWQRCTDEHTNHLLREYFLKGTRSPSRLEHDRMTLDSTSTKDVGVSDAGECTGDSYCKHRLSLRRIFIVGKADTSHVQSIVSIWIIVICLVLSATVKPPRGHGTSYTCGA